MSTATPTPPRPDYAARQAKVAAWEDKARALYAQGMSVPEVMSALWVATGVTFGYGQVLAWTRDLD